MNSIDANANNATTASNNGAATKKCTHSNCTNKAINIRSGTCRRHGEKCSVEGCHVAVYCRKLCRRHLNEMEKKKKRISNAGAAASSSSRSSLSMSASSSQSPTGGGRERGGGGGGGGGASIKSSGATAGSTSAPATATSTVSKRKGENADPPSTPSLRDLLQRYPKINRQILENLLYNNHKEDPPWRLTGHDWIGRCIRYRRNDEGTILAFLSNEDIDSSNNPAFVSTLTNRPENLFHVVFDTFVKDLEEIEIRGECVFLEEEKEEDVDAVVGKEKMNEKKIENENREEKAESDCDNDDDVDRTMNNEKKVSNQGDNTDDDFTGGCFAFLDQHVSIPSTKTINRIKDSNGQVPNDKNDSRDKGIDNINNNVGTNYSNSDSDCDNNGSTENNSKSRSHISSDDMQIQPEELAIGLQVDVLPRTGPGMNKLGGRAIITELLYDGKDKSANNNNGDDHNNNLTPIKVNVKYVLGGREKGLELRYVRKCIELGDRVALSSFGSPWAGEESCVIGSRYGSGSSSIGGEGGGRRGGSARGFVTRADTNSSTGVQSKLFGSKDDHDEDGKVIPSVTSNDSRRPASWRVLTLKSSKHQGEDEGRENDHNEEALNVKDDANHQSNKTNVENSDDGFWACRRCGHENDSERKRCKRCMGWKTAQSKIAAKRIKARTGDKDEVREEVKFDNDCGEVLLRWRCKTCGIENDAESKQCNGRNCVGMPPSLANRKNICRQGAVTGSRMAFKETDANETWLCRRCGLENHSDRKRCKKCRGWKAGFFSGEVKPRSDSAQAISEGGTTLRNSETNLDRNRWNCIQCGLENHLKKIQCEDCRGWKDGSIPRKNQHGQRDDKNQSDSGGKSSDGSNIVEHVGKDVWVCRSCGLENDYEQKRCVECNEQNSAFASSKSNLSNSDDVSCNGFDNIITSNHSSSSNIGSLRRVTFLQDSVETEMPQRIEEGICPSNERGRESEMNDSHEVISKEGDNTDIMERATDKTVPVVTPNGATVQTATMNLDSNSEDTNVLFNKELRSALSTYSSLRPLDSREVLPPPIPPPFLSHQEECTLRTALAFVMVQARKKNHEMASGIDSSCSNDTNLNQQVMNGRTPGWSRAIPNNNLFAKRPTMRTIDCSEVRKHISESIGHQDRMPSLLGSLLSVHPRLQARSAHRFSQSNPKLMFDREMNHIRDILRLAVSAVRPLYKGALRKSPDTNTAPCAVYDYEAAVMSAQELNAATSSSSETKTSKQHYMNLDGLCSHIVVRISRLIDDRKMADPKSTTLSTNLSSNVDSNEETGHDSKDSNDSNDHCRRLNNSNPTSEEKSKSFDIREAIIDLFCHNLIGEAFLCGPATLIPNFTVAGNPNLREERKIENIMSACHVFHRLLFLDKGCCFGTESVIAISKLLNDLYIDNIYARFESADRLSNPTDSDEISLDANNSTSIKDKVNVVSSRWSQSAIDYTQTRRQRRRQAIDSISESDVNEKLSIGNKRQMSSDKSLASTPYPLPSYGDVLAVNLLRLLEGAAAIRLHHRQVSCQSGRHNDIGMLTANVTSKTATEILTEIRSSTDSDLTVPLHIDDAATFYYNETRSREVQSDRSKSTSLLPGAKIMLRFQLFSLIKKLVLFEH